MIKVPPLQLLSSSRRGGNQGYHPQTRFQRDIDAWQRILEDFRHETSCLDWTYVGGRVWHVTATLKELAWISGLSKPIMRRVLTGVRIWSGAHYTLIKDTFSNRHYRLRETLYTLAIPNLGEPALDPEKQTIIEDYTGNKNYRKGKTSQKRERAFKEILRMHGSQQLEQLLQDLLYEAASRIVEDLEDGKLHIFT